MNALNWFTYNPFTRVLLNATGELDFQQLYFVNTKNFQKKKIKSCVINTEPFTIFDGNKIKGPDFEAFRVLTKHLNISDVLVETQPVNFSTMASTLYYAKHSLCDVFFSKTVIFNLEGMVNLPYPYRSDHLCIFLPKGKPLSGLNNVLLPFDDHVWAVILTSLLTESMLWMAIRWFNLSWHFEEKRISVLDFLKFYLCMPSNINSLRLVLSSRIFIAFALVCGCFITYAYQSVLIGFLLNPVYKRDLKTLKEVELSDFKILAPELELNIWRLKTKDSILLKSFFPVPSNINYEDSLTKYYDSQKFGYASRASWVKYLQSLKSNASFLDVYLVEECLLTVLFSHIFACDFPFSLRFQQIFNRFEEFGFTLYWDRNLYTHEDKSKRNPIDNTSVLNLEDLKGAIIIWYVGITIAFTAFCVEYLISVYIKNKCEI